MRVNIAVKFPFEGDHYDGVSLAPGVNLSTEPLPCVAGKTLMVFNNANKQPKCFIENASGVEEFEVAPQGYLMIDAIE